MNSFEKSLLALDSLFAKLSKEEMDRIVAEVDAMSATGLTVSAYLKEFENQFETFHNSHECWNITNIPGLESLHYEDEQIRTEQVIKVKHSKRVQYEFNIKTGENNYNVIDFLLAA